MLGVPGDFGGRGEHGGVEEDAGGSYVSSNQTEYLLLTAYGFGLGRD
jgi:hypothetical protein